MLKSTSTLVRSSSDPTDNPLPRQPAPLTDFTTATQRGLISCNDVRQPKTSPLNVPASFIFLYVFFPRNIAFQVVLNLLFIPGSICMQLVSLLSALRLEAFQSFSLVSGRTSQPSPCITITVGHLLTNWFLRAADKLISLYYFLPWKIILIILAEMI